MLIKTIDKAKYEDLKVQAALHNMKMKPRMDTSALEIPSDKKDKMDKLSVDLLNRMKTGKIKYGK